MQNDNCSRMDHALGGGGGGGGPVTQRVQSTYMVQSRVPVVVISLMVWVSIPYLGT